jgi:16S rRNA processing protein RimM
MKPDSHNEESLIVVARAVKPRGLKGEIVSDLLTDFPERFADITRMICLDPQGHRIEIGLENYWFQNGRVVLKLAGIDSVDSAAELVGHAFAVPATERVKLPTGQFYDWELEGCAVATVNGRQLGQVKEILRTGGVDTLVIENGENEDYLVPLAEDIVVKIDIAGKSVLIDPPEGLLEL